MKLGSGILALALTSFAAIATSNAADLNGGGYKDSYVAPPTWTGFYLGANAGGDWQSTKLTDSIHAGTLTPTGFVGGGQIGYNWQSGHLVFGPEIDIGGVDLHRFASYPDATYKNNGKLYGDFTGRLGYASGPSLLYVKGGAAVATVEDNAGYLFAPFSSYDKTKTLWGWTVGVGYEYLISPSWSLKLEYRYMEFDGTTLAKAPVDGGGTVKFGTTEANIISAGFNYHVGSVYTPLK